MVYPKHVRVELYNEASGRHEEVILHKSSVAIVENPLYAIVNEPNSTMQRLIRKLSLLDIVDEKTSSGKLDLIIQLPYLVKTPQRRQQAETRRKDIESQLAEGKYGTVETGAVKRGITNERLTRAGFFELSPAYESIRSACTGRAVYRTVRTVR